MTQTNVTTADTSTHEGICTEALGRLTSPARFPGFVAACVEDQLEESIASIHPLDHKKQAGVIAGALGFTGFLELKEGETPDQAVIRGVTEARAYYAKSAAEIKPSQQAQDYAELGLEVAAFGFATVYDKLVEDWDIEGFRAACGFKAD